MDALYLNRRIMYDIVKLSFQVSFQESSKNGSASIFFQQGLVFKATSFDFECRRISLAPSVM